MLRRFLLDLRDLESDCKEYFLQSDKESTLVTLGAIVFILPFAILLDYRFYASTPSFIGSVILDSLYLLISIAAMLAVRHTRTVQGYEYWVFAWSLSSGVVFSWLGFIQVERTIENVTAFLLFLMATYILLNNRLVFRLIPAILLTMVAISLLFLRGGKPLQEFPLFLSLLLMMLNMAGLVASGRHNRQKRSEFDSFQREKEARQRFESLSITDPLTGVLNRRAFLNHLEQEMYRFSRYRIPFTLVIIDLDYFKLVNDTYGHLAGDEALKLFSRDVTDLKRRADVLGRLGGEEFGLLLLETGGQEALKAVGRIQEKIRVTAIATTKGVFEITFCAGLSEVQPEDASLDDLVRRADVALYQAKNQGRDLCILG